MSGATTDSGSRPLTPLVTTKRFTTSSDVVAAALTASLLFGTTALSTAGWSGLSGGGAAACGAADGATGAVGAAEAVTTRVTGVAFCSRSGLHASAATDAARDSTEMAIAPTANPRDSS